MAVGDRRQHGGNSGYDDRVDVYYSWDSTVANHASVVEGDVVVFWDKRRMLGLSVVEEVSTDPGEKLLFRCPYCGRASIKARKTKSPKYLCNECKTEFDDPATVIAPVTNFRSRHDAAWTQLEGLFSGDELRGLCVSPGSQLSMRALNWPAFRDAMVNRGAGRAIERVATRAPDVVHPVEGELRIGFLGGHGQSLVRIRLGQQPFREHLLRSQGPVCAFTGRAPERVLEAGHLYSYAQLGKHDEHGGLLLRRDIHRLFDDGWLTVRPDTCKIRVTPTLAEFPQYALLDGQRLTVEVSRRQVAWLEKHWAEHAV